MMKILMWYSFIIMALCWISHFIDIFTEDDPEDIKLSVGTVIFGLPVVIYLALVAFWR